MKGLRHTILVLLLMSSCSGFLCAQTIEEQMTKSPPDCHTIFMNAMVVLPKLYSAQAFDSLHLAVDIWERSCSDLPEVKITRILLNLEEEKFTSSNDINGAALEMLMDYAKNFPSPEKMNSFSSYGGFNNSFFKFSMVWAKLLLENKKLDENETLICKVLTGEIKDPYKKIKNNPQTYPEYNLILAKNFEAKRKEVRGNIALSTGLWLPTNNLSTLGIHPSVGLLLGLRNAHHQLDLAVQFRFLKSANTYAVKRDGQPDSTDFYFGGYIGLDYTYYLFSKTRFDIGLLAGMGWDGFDFAPQPYDYYYDYPYYTSHVTIGSFNGNAGLRFNYYFNSSFYIGLQGRYNGIHYNTKGGTNLSGDAVSIDLIFGFNSSKYSK